MELINSLAKRTEGWGNGAPNSLGFSLSFLWKRKRRLGSEMEWGAKWDERGRGRPTRGSSVLIGTGGQGKGRVDDMMQRLKARSRLAHRRDVHL